MNRKKDNQSSIISSKSVKYMPF